MTRRYFIRLAYNGAAYCGWQIQPSDPTVQATIEAALSTMYNASIQVVGCGRTDTAVHASEYYLHTDLPERFSADNLVYKLNNLLPKDVRVYTIQEMDAKDHARFDAVARSYTYKMVFGKDPFRQHTVYRYDQSGIPDLDLMNEAAALLLEYKEFLPFCKTHADNDTYKCALTVSEWISINDNEWHYKVTSDRFLRGMVRLIVGMTLNIGLKRIELIDVKTAMDKQERLQRAWSVPAQGLYLSSIKYPQLG